MILSTIQTNILSGYSPYNVYVSSQVRAVEQSLHKEILITVIIPGDLVFIPPGVQDMSIIICASTLTL